jgi:restriction endonuclease S subunit
MIGRVLIPLPTKNEQPAFATGLSDSDAEIAALARRRNKTRVLI